MTPAARHAVIVPHFNDVNRLARCLTTLMAQHAALPDPTTVEIVVADNNSTQSLEGVRAAFPSVRILTEPKAGAANARNCGVEGTTAPKLIFLDADCIPGPGWLAHAISLVADEAVIGGRIDVFEETPPPRSGAEAFERVFAFRQRDYVEQKGFSVTANLVTTRAVFHATGPMVAGISEDVDWCRRAVDAGATLRYDDTLAVAHPARRDWPALAKKWRRLTDEMFCLNGTGLMARACWALRALAMPASALVHAPRVLANGDLNGVEKARALGTLLRLRLTRSAWMLDQAVRGRLS